MKPYRAIAEFYDPEYAHYDWLAQDVPFYLQHLPKRPQKVLELAVGTARAAIPIAQSGHHVVGIDCALDVLKIAAQKRLTAALSPTQLDLRRGDVTNLAASLKPKEKFDSIAIFFNTFLNFTSLHQQDKILSQVRKRLTPAGSFWLDVFQPNLPLIAADRSTDLDPYLFYVPSLDRTIYKTTEIRSNPTTQIQHVTFHYTWFDQNAIQRHARRDFDLTFLFPREFQLLIERHQMKIINLFGDYDASPLSPNSPRMIAQCQPA